MKKILQKFRSLFLSSDSSIESPLAADGQKVGEVANDSPHLERPDANDNSPVVFTYGDIEYLLPSAFSGVIGIEPGKHYPQAMIGPKDDDKFDDCLINLTCKDIGESLTDDQLSKMLSNYGFGSSEKLKIGPWEGFQSIEEKFESKGKTKIMRVMLLWGPRLMIANYSAPVNFFDLYEKDFFKILSDAKVFVSEAKKEELIQKHIEKALELVESGQYQAGITEYEAALDIDPECTEALYRLPAAYYRTKQFSKALKTLEKYVEIAPPDQSDRVAKAKGFVDTLRSLT